MGRKSNQDMPTVISGVLYTNDADNGINLNNPSEWNGFTEDRDCFYFDCGAGSFSCRNEIRRNEKYWYAFKRINGKLHKKYVGYRPSVATLEKVGAAFKALIDQSK